jgi:S1-C subfamily serine protease
MRRVDRPRRRVEAGLVAAVAAFELLVLLVPVLPVADGAPQSVSRPSVDRRARAAKAARDPVGVIAPRRAPLPADDWTYRPTVIVRRGTSQGSGTIIASVDGMTLVLTASHVVKTEGQVFVELHRYNVGMERKPATPGVWPRTVMATIAADDADADLAVLSIDKMVALPYVARLPHGKEEPPPDSIVTSIGIDLGKKLTSWNTRLVETVSIELNDSREMRPFLITEKIPEHGRSGGGLFQSNGELVGVCVGHAELVKGRRMGIFSSPENIRLLLDDHKLTAVVLRSETRLARLKKGRSPSAKDSSPALSSSVVTPTRSVGGGPPIRSAP